MSPLTPFIGITSSIRAQYSIYLPVHYRRIKSLLFLDGRGRSHKVGPAAKVGPCPIGVVNNGTGNISLLVPSDMPEGTNERYQNNSNAISKM